MLVWTNIAHGLLAFFWAQAARRVLRPRCPELAVTLSTLVLAVPPAVAVVQAVSPAPWTLLRVPGWHAALATVGLAGWAPAVLAGGTGLLFVAQELLPLLTRRRAWRRAPRGPHPRLDAARAAVLPGFRALGLDAPPVRCVDSGTPMAALVGLRAPEVVVSRVLIDALDDRQLEALLAHELAHAARGGNRRLTLLWLLRAAQALNPAALIAFRQLVETEEAACDALAARATKRPADLASVLIEVERLRGATRAAEDAPGEPGAHLALLQRRVRRLLDGVAEQGPRGPVGLAAAALLGALLWGVGMIPGAPRWLALIALTVALAGALWWVDQRVVDEPPPNAWRAFATLDALPPDARVPDPTLLSPSLGWPPAQIWHRPGAGTWLALGAPPRAWLGTWTGDVPAALGPWAACLDDAPGCPDGWQARAAAEPDGWRRAALLQGDAAAADRLFRGLRAATPIK